MAAICLGGDELNHSWNTLYIIGFADLLIMLFLNGSKTEPSIYRADIGNHEIYAHVQFNL